jgi:thiazole synthase
MDGSQVAAEDTWTVAGRVFRSRLIVGTGKYKDYALNAAAAEAAGAEMVTVALRRVNLSDPSQPMLTDFVRPDRFTYVPNTAGCFTGEEAVRTLRLAREAGGWDLVKLEVLTRTAHLYPDMEETLRARRSAPASVCRTASTSASLSSRRTCRCWWTPASAPRPMRRSPWSSAATRC